MFSCFCSKKELTHEEKKIASIKRLKLLPLYNKYYSKIYSSS